MNNSDVGESVGDGDGWDNEGWGEEEWDMIDADGELKMRQEDVPSIDEQDKMPELPTIRVS